jgi:formylglycine-generating enzyme required for sulfatase activity
MKCQQCQHDWPEHFRFCPDCGIPIAAAPMAARPSVVGDGSIAAGGHAVQAAEGATVVFAEQGATVVIGEAPVPMTAVDRESALGRYLQHVISRNRYLQLQGIRSGGRLVHIELDRIYVTLRATRQPILNGSEGADEGRIPSDSEGPPLPEDAWLAGEAALAPGERRRLRDGPSSIPRAVTIRVDEALAAHPRLAVLGDPGSGKTTLLRYLALLYARDLAAGTTVVRQELNLEESGRLPVLLPLRQIGAYLREHHPAEDGTEGHALLLEFLLRALANERIELPGDFFDGYLAAGDAVLLFDGLDEVADPGLRRRVSRLVEAFTRAYPDCRYVVTSRIVGYTGPARLGEGYATTTVREFTLADVERFLSNWHRLVAVGQMGPGRSAEVYAASQTRQLLDAIEANERIRELAINPLMLTVIAMVHRDRVKLPDRRAELYAEAVDVLLGKWEEAKGLAELPVLEEGVFDTGDRRLMLQGIALRLHEAKWKEVAAGDLRDWLGELFGQILDDPRAVERAVDRFLRVVEERTGLLVARGEGIYAFSHLTFQEYLAALAVAAREDYLAYTLARTPDPWWREVVLLEAGYLSTQSRERTTRLIQAIAGLKDEPEPYHNLVLAAECLRDVGGKRVLGDLEAEVQRRLRRELEVRPPVWSLWLGKRATQTWIEQRSRAMEALVRAGAGYWTLPYGEPEWIEVPAGEFWMGSEEGQGDERTLHRVYLEAFCISRVPVTEAQYHLFVKATGHRPPDHWEEGRPPRDLESHPVVNVSWHDALAYCRWLAEVTGQPVTLPSEAQWEKAARGDRDRRAFPWGDDFDRTRCNTWELGLAGTTPVGIFPEGASPYGALDMAGNVWEWTRSIYRAYPYRPDDGREDLEAGEEIGRVLRGGSWFFKWYYARCARRRSDRPDYRFYLYGFRVVLAPALPRSDF